MPRPLAYSREAVLGAARDAFWENGYEGTPLSELEKRTGLNRSSLYLAFGSKSALFEAALDRYADDVIDPLLGPLESDPSLVGIRSFLGRVKAIIVSEFEQGHAGCLMVNTIAELSTKDQATARRTIGFRDRLERALTRALEVELPDAEVATLSRRGRLLLASVIGIWTCARIDLRNAAVLCDEVAAEVASWAPRRDRLRGQRLG